MKKNSAHRCRIPNNKFAWYGTTKRFETLSQTFVATDLGTFNAHHYRYAPGMSTFLVECDSATWQAYGFADKTIEQSQAICQEVFAATLDGHQTDFEQIGVAQFPVDLERALEPSETWC